MNTGKKENKRLQILLLAILGATLSFTTYFLVTLSCSLFLKNIGVKYLPFFYIAVNIFTVALGVFLITRKASHVRGFIILCLVMAGVFVLIFLSWETTFKGIFFLIYVTATIFLMYGMIFFWNLINNIFSMTEMKMYIGIVTACNFLGAISAGLLMKPILGLISARSCYLAASLSIMVIVAILSIYLRQFEYREEGEMEKGKFVPGELFEIETIRLLITFTILFVFIRYLVDFQFSRNLALSFADAKSLSGYLGLFNSTVFTLIFIWQAFLLRKTLKSYPIAYFFAFMAFTFLILSIICIAHNGMFNVALFQASVLFLFKTFKQPAQNIVVKAIIPEIRPRANFLLCGITESLSIMTSGIVIAAMNSLRIPSHIFFILITTVAASALILTLLLKKSYVDLLLRNIRSRKPELIQNLAANEDYNPAITLGAEEKEVKSQILHLLNTEEEPHVLATLIKTISSHKKNRPYGDEIVRIMKSHVDFRLVMQCVDTLAIWNAYEYAHEVADMIQNNNPWIKASSIMFIIRQSRDYGHNEKAVKELVNMIHSPDSLTRGLAVSIQGELGLECFVPGVATLLHDHDIKVRKRAVVAAQKLKSPALLPVLQEISLREENESLKNLINRVVDYTGDALLSDIFVLTRRLSHAERQKVIASVQSLDAPLPLEIILKSLELLDPPFSVAIVEIANARRSDRDFLKMLKSCFEETEFSFVPLIGYAISVKDPASLNELFYALSAGGANLTRFISSFQVIAKNLEEGEDCRAKAKALLDLGIKASIGREHARAILGHLHSPEKREDLSTEILESSVQDRSMREALFKLLHML